MAETPYLQKIQEVIIKITMKLESEVDMSPIPYGVPACRKALYEVLLESVKFPCTEWPPPTQCAVTIFTKGTQDSDQEVSI